MTGLTALVRRRQAPCAEVAVALPAYVAGEGDLEPRLAGHVAQCLRCQAETVRYRRMLRTLHELRDDEPVAPSTVLSDIISQLRGDEVGGRTLLGIVAIVGLVAGAASGAGVLLWVTRRAHGGGRSARLLQEMVIRLPMRSATTKAMTRA